MSPTAAFVDGSNMAIPRPCITIATYAVETVKSKASRNDEDDRRRNPTIIMIRLPNLSDNRPKSTAVAAATTENNAIVDPISKELTPFWYRIRGKARSTIPFVAHPVNWMPKMTVSNRDKRVSTFLVQGYS